MLTQHVVNPVNNAYSMFTGDSKPLIPMPESEQKIAGRVVNAGIYQAALKKLGIYDAKAIEEYIAKKIL